MIIFTNLLCLSTKSQQGGFKEGAAPLQDWVRLSVGPDPVILATLRIVSTRRSPGAIRPVQALRRVRVPSDLYVNLCKLGPPALVHCLGGGPRDLSACSVYPLIRFHPLF